MEVGQAFCCRYLNNVIGQNHRAIKRRCASMKLNGKVRPSGCKRAIEKLRWV